MIIAIIPVCICFCVQINQVPSPSDTYYINRNSNPYDREEKCTYRNYIMSEGFIHRTATCLASVCNNQIICLSIIGVDNPYIIIQLRDAWIIFMIADCRTTFASHLPFISNFSLSFCHDQIFDHRMLTFTFFLRIHFRWRCINDILISSAINLLRSAEFGDSADLLVNILGSQSI